MCMVQTKILMIFSLGNLIELFDIVKNPYNNSVMVSARTFEVMFSQTLSDKHQVFIKNVALGNYVCYWFMPKVCDKEETWRKTFTMFFQTVLLMFCCECRFID